MKKTCCFLLFSICLAVAGQASAKPCAKQDEDAAKVDADSARDALREHQQDEAIRFLEKSRDHCPLPEPVFLLAQQYESLGRWASAWRAYEQVKASDHASRTRRKAEQNAASLQARVPHIVVAAPSAVTVEGRSFKVMLELDRQSFESGRTAKDPGPHEIKYSIDSKFTGSREITAISGQEQTILIKEKDILDLPDRPSLVVTSEVSELELRHEDKLLKTQTPVYLDANGLYELQFSAPCKQPGHRSVAVNGRTTETITKADIEGLADIPCCLSLCPRPPRPVPVRFDVAQQAPGYELLFRGKAVAPNSSARVQSGPFVIVARAPGFNTEVVTDEIPDNSPAEHVIKIPTLSPKTTTPRGSPILRWAPAALFGLATAAATIWYVGETHAEKDALGRVRTNQSDPTLYPVAVSNLRDAHDGRVRAGWVLAGSATLFAGSLVVAFLTGSPQTVQGGTSFSASFLPNGMMVALRGPVFW